MPTSLVRRGWLAIFLILILVCALWLPLATRATASQSSGLTIRQNNGEYSLSAPKLGTFHSTRNEIQHARLIEVPDSPVRLAVWEELRADGSLVPFYAISTDGLRVARVEETSYEILLRYKKFDPAVERPAIPQKLAADEAAEDGVYIVQFVTQPLEEFRAEVSALGGHIYTFLANHAYLVKMNPRTRREVAALPFVRSVSLYQPAYRLEEFLLEHLTEQGFNLPPMRYNIMVLERGLTQETPVAERISALGGRVWQKIPQGFRIEATLTGEQLLEVTRLNEVLFIDRWSAPEPDMDIVRSVGGANFIETTLGFTGEGVRAEVMDGNMLETHVDFQSMPATLFHGGRSGEPFHGTSTFGIVFGDGTGNAAARGMLPKAQKIFASYELLFNRYTHTQELVSLPLNAVFQSNSWGNDTTTAYTTISAEMDDILFHNDFTIIQSQSNSASRLSRPQAWAKNIVSIGGVRHQNTANFSDDCWCNSASIGPASDGRIKPDLASFYDSVFTTTASSTTSYTQFAGTSASTPIVAGHFGIFFEMWHHGIFGNPTAGSVFESRPHMTTAKAFMINTARQWNATGVSADLTREKQGWGMPDLQNLYNLRNKMFVVNETDVLPNLGSKSYALDVPQGGAPFKATLVFADPMGNPASAQQRINDLSLKVTSPSNVVYRGNVGLTGSGQWSTTGGSANTIDTVENVFIQNPEAGRWTVEVIASQVVQDSHLETPTVDADYALVVSGVNRATRKAPFDFDGDGKTDISVFRPSSGIWYILQSNNSNMLAQGWGLSTDLLAPADYDGDGKADLAVYRPGTPATWYILLSSDGSLRAEAWGTTGDVPLPADYDGDGRADIAVWRPSNGTWYISLSTTNTLRAEAFGLSGDVPVAADYDGDGKADVVVFRPSSGIWYVLQSNDSNVRVEAFGMSGDVPVAADYDADGKADIAVFRPGNSVWFVINSSNGTFSAQAWGTGGDRPAPGDYDGDGRADLTVFRPDDGNWYIFQSTSGSLRAEHWGTSEDAAIPSAYIP